MKITAALVLIVVLAGCSIGTVQNSKSLYIHAQGAANAGHDAEAIVYWKKVIEQTSGEIKEGKYLTTNYFLRASAYFELGNWDKGFEDLKQVHPGELQDEEMWIYPLYAILMGDYYSQQGMASVGENFYQSVLNKSTLKSSPIYLLALERHINNAIKTTESRAAGRPDAEKIRTVGFEELRKEAVKYTENFPFSAIPHFLLGDLLLKTGRSDESLEQFLASIELGLPTSDLQESAEFQIATLIADYPISPAMKAVLLRKAPQLWNQPPAQSIFHAEENSVQKILLESGIDVPEEIKSEPESRIRFLAVSKEGRLKIILWEKL
jgi:tetratricopeptide (TPR) repeat protein